MSKACFLFSCLDCFLSHAPSQAFDASSLLMLVPINQHQHSWSVLNNFLFLKAHLLLYCYFLFPLNSNLTGCFLLCSFTCSCNLCKDKRQRIMNKTPIFSQVGLTIWSSDCCDLGYIMHSSTA